MVARSPPKLQRKMVTASLPLDPILLRETVKKVDRCMARLQELQYTVNGGKKAISGVNPSPRSTRSYLKTSLRCKQESLRLRNTNSRRSPGKMPTNSEEWKRMSLPAMLLGETIGEIVKTSQFARNIVDAVAKNPTTDDPKTPMTDKKRQKPNLGNAELLSRRKREKQLVLQNVRSESVVPLVRRAKSKINFKISPVRQRECDKENCKYIANRVSPRNKPWARKTVLFPNPVFYSSPTKQQPKICKTKSPVSARNGKTKTPHKFLIKSPPQSSKFQVKIKSPPLTISPTRGTKLSPKLSSAAKFRRSFSPSRIVNSQKVSSAAATLRRSFSPSRLANKLASISPLKSRKSFVQKNEGTKVMSGLKQRPTIPMTVRFSPRRI